MRTYIPLGPDGSLSYTRDLSIFIAALTQPQDLEEIYDHLMAFKSVRKLQTCLFATDFVKKGLVLFSRYFPHFQSTLRHLIEAPRNFPIHPPLPDSESEGFDPDLFSPLKGTLRLNRFQYWKHFATELAKVQIQYHPLSICDAMVWKGIQELTIDCAPTLRTLNITRESCKFFPPVLGPGLKWPPLGS
jgi:hypothetical protein